MHRAGLQILVTSASPYQRDPCLAPSAIYRRPIPARVNPLLPPAVPLPSVTSGCNSAASVIELAGPSPTMAASLKFSSETIRTLVLLSGHHRLGDTHSDSTIGMFHDDDDANVKCRYKYGIRKP